MAMQVSQSMIGSMTISTVVDQILALLLREGQHVPEDKHVTCKKPQMNNIKTLKMVGSRDS